MNGKLIFKAVLTGVIAIAGVVVQALPDGTEKKDDNTAKADNKED